MQTSLGTRHLKMGMWMLNMQFNADKGLLWSIKSPKINNIENPNSVFSKFTPTRVIRFIWIFGLVHHTNKIQNNPNCNSKRKRFNVYCCNAKVKLFTFLWRNWKILESIFVAFPSERRQIQRLFDLECFPISSSTIFIVFLSNTHKHS